MLLELKEVKVHYGKVEALKGISFEIEEGQVTSLVGANGAGKSTVLRTICCLNKPTSGEIWFQGKRIDTMSAQQIVSSGISLVPEGRRVFPLMTVIDNLRLGATLIKNKKEITRTLEEVFESFPILKERMKQRASSLSGGEQQMLAIGRALMSKPRLLLMDEPSLGLSPFMCRNISRIITRINQNGTTIILAEQNVRLAFGIANRGYVLEIGKIVLEGSTKDLINSEYVKRAYLGG
jgi:branched-chain amino acid transport system ATP-binding protein